jgi:flagellar hook assembly protein FlgD
MQIFDSIGREVRTLARNLVTGATGILAWDGRFDNGNRARIGIYIIKVDAVDQSTGQSVEWVKTAVLAEVLR